MRRSRFHLRTLAMALAIALGGFALTSQAALATGSFGASAVLPMGQEVTGVLMSMGIGEPLLAIAKVGTGVTVLSIIAQRQITAITLGIATASTLAFAVALGIGPPTLMMAAQALLLAASLAFAVYLLRHTTTGTRAFERVRALATGTQERIATTLAPAKLIERVLPAPEPVPLR